MLIFSNQIEKKINKVSTNNNFFFNFILKTIKGISVRSSIINIIIIYIIFWVAIFCSVYFLIVIKTELVTLCKDYIESLDS